MEYTTAMERPVFYIDEVDDSVNASSVDGDELASALGPYHFLEAMQSVYNHADFLQQRPVVAVIDTIGTQAMMDRWGADHVSGYNFYLNNDQFIDFNLSSSHGTAMAEAPRRVGLWQGVQRFNLLYLAVMSTDGVENAGWSGVEKAISYALDRDVCTIGMSIASETAPESLSPVLQRAWDMGVPMFGAAGNYGKDKIYALGSDSRVLSMGALNSDPTRTLWHKSNHPAELYASRSGYVYGGTSMATAHANAAAALMAYDRDFGLQGSRRKPGGVHEQFLKTATVTDDGYPALDLDRAVKEKYTIFMPFISR